MNFRSINDCIQASLPQMDSLFQWIQNSAVSDKKLTKEKEKTAKKQALHDFTNRVTHISSDIKSTLELYCQPQDYCLSANEYFFKHFSELLSQPAICEPRKSDEIDKLKQNFSESLALFSYARKRDLSEQLKSINAKVLQLFNCKKLDNSGKISRISKVFNKMLDSPCLLDVPIAILIKKSSFENLEYSISLIDLLKAHKKIHFGINANADHVISVIIERLSQHNYQEIIDFLEKLKEFRTKYLPLIDKFGANSFSEFTSNEKHNQMERFALALNWIVNGEGNVNFSITEDEEHYFLGNELFCLQDPSKKIAELKSELRAIPQSSQKFKEIQSLIELYESQFFCYCLLDFYLVKPFDTLVSVTQSLIANCSKLNPREIQKINRDFRANAAKEKENVQNRQNSSSKGNESVEQLMAFIESSSDQSKGEKKTVRGKRKRNKEKAKKPTSNKEIPAQIPLVLSTEKDYQEIRRLSSLLVHLCSNAKYILLKGYFHQAHMYLEDLILAHQNLMNSALSDNLRRFYILTFLQAAYFCLEILFHAEEAVNDPKNFKIEGNGHDLTKLQEKAHFKIGKDSLISQLGLTNYWVRSPLEEACEEDAVQFQLLTDIRRIYEAKTLNNNSELEVTIKKIENLLPEITGFIKQLPTILKVNAEDFPVFPPKSFTADHSFPLSTLHDLHQKCSELMNKLPSTHLHQLSQIMVYLKLIEGILEAFNKKEISTNLFSLLTRHLIFWENTFLEKFLHLVYQLKTGKELRTHELTQIKNKINWKHPLIESDHKLLKIFAKIHNISRYPFTTERKENFLHDLILEAELVRVGSKLENESAEGVKKQSPQDVIHKLRDTTERIFQFVNTVVLPELEPIS